MHRNNTVYKGYLLTAQVERLVDEGGSPRFIATVLVAPSDMIQRQGEPYVPPAFADGDHADSPRDAVHIAIAHGCDIVEAIQGNIVAN